MGTSYLTRPCREPRARRCHCCALPYRGGRRSGASAIDVSSAGRVAAIGRAGFCVDDAVTVSARASRPRTGQRAHVWSTGTVRPDGWAPTLDRVGPRSSSRSIRLRAQLTGERRCSLSGNDEKIRKLRNVTRSIATSVPRPTGVMHLSRRRSSTNWPVSAANGRLIPACLGRSRFYSLSKRALVIGGTVDRHRDRPQLRSYRTPVTMQRR